MIVLQAAYELKMRSFLSLTTYQDKLRSQDPGRSASCPHVTYLKLCAWLAELLIDGQLVQTERQTDPNAVEPAGLAVKSTAGER